MGQAVFVARGLDGLSQFFRTSGTRRRARHWTADTGCENEKSEKEVRHGAEIYTGEDKKAGDGCKRAYFSITAEPGFPEWMIILPGGHIGFIGLPEEEVPGERHGGSENSGWLDARPA